MPTDIDLAAHCQKCHHADCASGTADFQSLCEERALANERINKLALQRRDEVEAESSCDPVDALTCERAINARLVKRIAELERALAARIEKQIDGLAERTALVARVEELERERDHFARRYDEMCSAIGKAGAARDRLAAELAEARALVEQTERRLLSSNERWQEAVNEAGELRAERDAAIARAEQYLATMENLERVVGNRAADAKAIERATVEAIATWIDETADKWCAKHGGTMAGAADSLAKSIRSGAWRKERGGE